MCGARRAPGGAIEGGDYSGAALIRVTHTVKLRIPQGIFFSSTVGGGGVGGGGEEVEFHLKISALSMWLTCCVFFNWSPF